MLWRLIVMLPGIDQWIYEVVKSCVLFLVQPDIR